MLFSFFCRWWSWIWRCTRCTRNASIIY